MFISATQIPYFLRFLTLIWFGSVCNTHLIPNGTYLDFRKVIWITKILTKHYIFQDTAYSKTSSVNGIELRNRNHQKLIKKIVIFVFNFLFHNSDFYLESYNWIAITCKIIALGNKLMHFTSELWKTIVIFPSVITTYYIV